MRRHPDQIELFPTPVSIDSLDPRLAIGPDTRVQGLFRVRIGDDARATTHTVFHDRHGWYCETHGRQCEAAKLAAGRLAATADCG